METITLDKTAIEALIPHRRPMLLLDSAEILSAAEIRGAYQIKGDEYFLQGHYPQNPIVPGNIQSEMLAQLGAVLIHYNMTLPEMPFAALRQNRTPLLAGLDNVRFKKTVHPGDKLDLFIHITKDVGLLVNAEGSATISGQDTALTAQLILAFI